MGTSTQLKVFDLQSQSMLSLEELYILDHDNFVEANPLYCPLCKYFRLTL